MFFNHHCIFIIDEIVEEQCSGTIPFERREKAFELLKKLKSNDHIICSHLDRFCRNTLSLLQMIQRFKKRKIYLHFVDLNLKQLVQMLSVMCS